MDEPKAWRDLAERFTQLYAGGPDNLCANWISSSWNDNGDHWYVSGVNDPAVHKLFEWAVERAAVLLGHSGSPLFSWLDLLKEESPRYRGGGSSETAVDGNRIDKSETGDIPMLCLASAEYCYRLETRAIEAERKGRVSPRRSPEMEALTERKRMDFHEAIANSPENRAQREFQFEKELARLRAEEGKKSETAPTLSVATTTQLLDRKGLRDSYLAAFPNEQILDICWAAAQHYSEWKRWLRGPEVLKDGSAPDVAFKALLSGNKKPTEYRKQTRPKGWK